MQVRRNAELTPGIGQANFELARLSAPDGILEVMRVLRVARYTDRHLEDLPALNAHSFQSKSGRGRVLTFVHSRHGLTALDEFFIGHRLVEGDELDLSRGEKPLVNRYEFIAICP